MERVAQGEEEPMPTLPAPPTRRLPETVKAEVLAKVETLRKVEVALVVVPETTERFVIEEEALTMMPSVVVVGMR